VEPVIAPAPVPPVLHLSQVVGGALRDGAGGRLGRVEDLIGRLGASLLAAAILPIATVVAVTGSLSLVLAAVTLAGLRSLTAPRRPARAPWAA
jgi:hypothetical protein